MAPITNTFFDRSFLETTIKQISNTDNMVKTIIERRTTGTSWKKLAVTALVAGIASAPAAECFVPNKFARRAGK
jgi:hypothetical protein